MPTAVAFVELIVSFFAFSLIAAVLTTRWEPFSERLDRIVGTSPTAAVTGAEFVRFALEVAAHSFGCLPTSSTAFLIDTEGAPLFGICIIDGGTTVVLLSFFTILFWAFSLPSIVG